MSEANDRVRHPVPVVAVVQSFDRTVDGEVQADCAAGAEDEFHPAALMDRAVAKDPGVGAQLVPEFFQVIGEMRRAGFFFTLENETKTDRWLQSGFAHRIEGGE